MVLKGAHHTCHAVVVTESLKREGHAVRSSTLYRTDNKDKQFNSFVVKLEDSAYVIEVSKKDSLLKQKVHWERLKPKAPTLYINCIRPGHSAANCGNKFRCVKCSADHYKGACLRKVRDGEVYYVNCCKVGQITRDAFAF